jgi:hypothetical protein
MTGGDASENSADKTFELKMFTIVEYNIKIVDLKQLNRTINNYTEDTSNGTLVIDNINETTGENLNSTNIEVENTTNSIGNDTNSDASEVSNQNNSSISSNDTNSKIEDGTEGKVAKFIDSSVQQKIVCMAFSISS